MNRDRGSGTVLALATIGVLCVVMLAGLAIGAAHQASARARTAADLAAVAGAQLLITDASNGVVCERAGVIATANDAHLESCTQSEGAEGPRVTVEVSVDAGWLGRAQATADAGLRALQE